MIWVGRRPVRWFTMIRMRPHGKLFVVDSALRQRGLVTIDELRRHLEGLTKEQYDLPYYDRWGKL